MKLACTILLTGAVLASALPAVADVFPPITDAEKALTAVPNEPNAPAVILFRKAEFLMWGYDSRGAIDSRLLIQVRKKILTEEGKNHAELTVAHSADYRLSTASFHGRTVLPDGRVVPVGSDARFERKLSKRLNESITTVTFPAVEVGAILDCQYEIRFESIFFLEPWYFSDDLPVLHSEIVFKIPREVQSMAWNRDPARVGIKKETSTSSRGSEVRVWADNLPSVPDDPFGPPFADQAVQMMMVPTVLDDGTSHIRLMESWASVCGILDEVYGKARRKDGGVEKKAKEIAATGSAGERARALYRFVRDQIETDPSVWIGLPEGSAVQKTLEQRRGTPAEKALLLQSLSSAAGLGGRLVWAGSRWNGQIDPQVANPLWFNRVLVALDVDGQRWYLDPSDRALAFGWLLSGYEGMPALIHDAKKPEGVVLPRTAFDRSARRAVIDLALGADGRLAGKGEVTFTGHYAWEKIDWKDDEAATLEGWKEWLGEDFKSFQLDDIKFQELADEQTVRVTWSMKQREEEVLGDEVSLAPSRPLGPLGQPLPQEAAKRRSTVLFPYPDRNEVELRLSWPEGWRIEARPTNASLKNRVGELAVSLEVDEAARSLVYRRRLDLVQAELATLQLYQEARDLFQKTEKSDAEALALAHR